MAKEIELTYGMAEDIMNNPHFEEILSLDITFSFHLWFAKMRRKLLEETKEYLETKRTLLEKHLVMDENGQPAAKMVNGVQQIQFKSREDAETFTEEITRLRNEKLILPGVAPLYVDADDARFNALKGHHVTLLLPFIAEDVVEAEVVEAGD